MPDPQHTAFAPPPVAPAMLRRAPRLVTFDIDGTLLKALGPRGNAAHIAAVDAAVASVYAVTSRVRDVDHKGSTDRAIIRDMCLHAGLEQSLIDARMPAALADAAARIDDLLADDDTPPQPLPGVVALLDGLRAAGVPVALATGNIQRIAWAKLRGARLADYFECGGFGCDAEHRADIVRLAIRRAGGFDPADCVHVGDAVADVAAARTVGAAGVGVLTGAFSRKQLVAERPLLVVDDLSDTPAVLAALGIADAVDAA